MTVVAQVNPSLPAGTLINLAAAASPDAQTVTDTVTTTVDTAAALRISKTALNSPSKPGRSCSIRSSAMTGRQRRGERHHHRHPARRREPMPAATAPALRTAAEEKFVCAIGARRLRARKRSLLVNVTVAANLPDGTTLTNCMLPPALPRASSVTDSVDTVVRQPQGERQTSS